MNYEDLKALYEHSPALRLLRSPQMPMVLSFLYRVFKTDQVVSREESRLQALLREHLDAVRDEDRQNYRDSARDYLVRWCDDEHGYMRRYHPERSDEPVYELTAETERVFQWVESLKPTTHVGTESKFKSISATLTDILDNVTTSPDERIQRLRAEQQAIGERIAEIERSGVVETYTSTMINERFAAVLATARELLGDFRAVEEHFRRVSRDLAERHTQTGITRGEIVGRTLDAQDDLRKSDQGQSFYAFWEFLLSPSRREELRTLIDLAYVLPDLANELRTDPLLGRLQPRLRAEGERVIQSNQRLIAQLRRVLDTHQIQDRREITELLKEIKTAAFAVRDEPPSDDFLEVDEAPALTSLMARPAWSPSVATDFVGGIVASDGGDSRAAFVAWLELQSIDFEALRGNIRESLRSRVQITLAELLEICPLRNGILDVLAYVLIAESDGPHLVLDEADVLILPGDTLGRRFRVPQIIFSNS